MANNIALLCTVCVSLLIGIHASGAGELSVLYSPKALQFLGSQPVSESFMKDIYAASLGLSVDQDSKWNGLLILDPFKTPEAAVKVYIDGITSLGKVPNLQKKIDYPVVLDQYDPDTFNMIKHIIKQRYAEGDSNLVFINLSDNDQLKAYPEVFGTIDTPKPAKVTLNHLKMNVDADYLFFVELAAINALTEKVASGNIIADGIIDFYEFRFTSLHILSDFHGPKSAQVAEAIPLLADALNRLSSAFQKAYDGAVLMTMVTSDVAHTRRVVRAAPTFERQAAQDSYSADYAAIFNIILWFSVVFAFSLIAIVYAIMDMDPGRDSIIYRMTTMKTMKKEN